MATIRIAWKSRAIPSRPMVEVGFSKNCAQQIRDVSYSAKKSRFVLRDEEFEIPMFGEFNVRNAAMAISAAKFYGVSAETIRAALPRFEGVARRQEIRGEVRGVKVIDDFGHHPTAIAQTLTALRRRYPKHRLWAIFEPRSNTTRRAVFQARIAQCAEDCRRRFHFASREARTNPGSGTIKSRGRDERNQTRGPARVLRAKCRRDC